MANIQRWVQDFYASVFSEEAMRRELENLSQYFDANYIALQFEGRKRFFMMSNRELGTLLHLYEASAFDNPYIARGTRRLQAGGAVRGSDVVSQKQVHRTAFYAEIMRPVDVEYSLGGLVWQGGETLAIVSINRPASGVDFSRRDSQLLEQLLPDMRTAIDLHLQFREHQESVNCLEAALDQSRDGMFWLDRDGVLLRCNAAAHAMLDAQSPVVLDARRQLRDSESSKLLLASHELRQAGDLPLRGGAGVLTHWVTVTELTPAARYTMPDKGHMMIRIRDLRDVTLPPAELLQRLFSLTRREAEVCLALLTSTERKAIARSLGMSPETVKTHLAHIYRKTQSKGRSALLRLLERLVL